jgi:hypothetical protein
MRTLLRRLTIFPIVVIGSPLLYFIGYCIVGHEEAIEDIKRLLSFTWYGDI